MYGKNNGKLTKTKTKNVQGAVYFLVDLSRRLTITHSVHFIQASSYHDGQLQEELVKIGGALEPKRFLNKKVVLVDELYDNGRTMAAVKDRLLSTAELKLTEQDVRSCVAFRKRKPESLFAPPDYAGIDDLPDLWFVGYGLDDSGLQRNLVELFAVPKIAGVTPTDDDVIFDDGEQGKARLDAIHAQIRTALDTAN
jgi:hypoxanthine phosphoribosyltransferase